VFEREPLPNGASWTLARSYDPFGADDLAELMRQDGLAHQGDAPAQAQKLSDAALSFLQWRRMHEQPPPGERQARLQRLATLARQLATAMPSDYSDLFPPDIGHAPAVRALCGITPDMEKTNWPAVKDAARSVKEGLFYELPHLLQLLEAAAKYQAAELAPSKRQGPQTDTARHDFVARCIAVFENASGRMGWKTSRPGLESGGPRQRGGPAPRFLAAVCALYLARLHPSELEDVPMFGKMLAEGSRPEVAALWIEQARNIRAKLGEE